MGKKKVGIIVLAILGFVILVIGVPLIINACYQCDTAIITTEWGAEDALSYYGTLLSAFATITVLSITISFTRKQIHRDRFLEKNREKWEKVDAVITQALSDISPLKLRAAGNMDTPNVMIFNRLSDIHSYMIVAKTSLNMVKCYINPGEYEQIKDYIDKITDAANQFCMIAHELEIEYLLLQDRTFHNGGQVPEADYLYHLSKTNEIIKKIPPAYDGTYQNLLDRKREVFDKIYADIDAQADRILKFGRKK